MGFPVCSDFSSFQGFVTGWQPVVIMATFIVFLVAGLAYILAGVANHRGVRLWAINQVYEGIVTLIFALFFIGLVQWACTLDAHMLGDDVKCAPCPEAVAGADPTLACTQPAFFNIQNLTVANHCGTFKVAEFYVQDFRNTIEQAFTTVAVLNGFIAFASTFTWYTAPGGIGMQVSLGHGLTQVSQSLSMGISAIGVGLLLAMAQVLLVRISEQLFGYLMVAGLLLRSFGATRGFGGSLIAIAVGFFLVYPLAIVLLYGLLLNNLHNDYQDLVGATQSSSNAFSGIQDALASINNMINPVAWIGNGVNAAFGFIATLAVGIIFIPLVIFIVLISFIKGLSAAIGEEVDVSNLTRLI